MPSVLAVSAEEKKRIDPWAVRLKVLSNRERGVNGYAGLTHREALVYQYVEHGFGCASCAWQSRRGRDGGD